MPFVRATRTAPCPICGRVKFCSVTEDGALALCTKVSEGARKQARNGDWVHVIGEGDFSAPRVYTLPSPPPDWTTFMPQAQAATPEPWLRALSRRLGVSVRSLKRLGCFRSQKYPGAAAFPMTRDDGRVVGIRFRGPGGGKWAARGGREGIFLPKDLAGGGPLLVCEGPTDTAAALDLELDAVGRPSCRGGNDYLVKTILDRQVVVVADRDDVGWQGAVDFGTLARIYRTTSVKVIQPPEPYKDLRAWVCGSGTLSDVLAAIGEAQCLPLVLNTGEEAST